MARVGDVGGEHDRLLARAVTMPVCYDVAHELRGVHSLCQLHFAVVAGLDADALQVGPLGRREDDRRHQEAEFDQLRRLRTLDDRLEYATEPATILSAGRCCQTK